jgi:hypothetical protein
MSRFKMIIGAVLFFLGLTIIIGGEITTVAWCLYDLIDLVKSDSVSFWECMWLVFVRVCGGVCVGFVGIMITFTGVVIAGVTK